MNLVFSNIFKVAIEGISIQIRAGRNNYQYVIRLFGDCWYAVSGKSHSVPITVSVRQKA